MIKRSLTTLLLGAALLLMAAYPAQAQLGPRSNSGFFVGLKGGLAYYAGDLGKTDIPGDGDMMVGGELGWRFIPSLSLHLQYFRSNYNNIETIRPGGLTTRYSAAAYLQYNFLPRAAVSPYLLAGVATTLGYPDSQDNPGQHENTFAFGPGAGLGLDWAFNRGRTALYLEAALWRQTPDRVVDYVGGSPTVMPGADNNADYIGYGVLGLRFFARPVITPVDVLGVDCPSTLLVDQPGTFAATTNQDASRPLTYTWNWGDGTTSEGMTATHSYSRAGTYTVTFTATGRANTDTGVCTVTVETPVEAAVIASINASPNPALVGQTVTFTSNVRGTPPFTYRWDFGDGATASTANATHAYSAPGTYTVTFTVSNSAGSDTRTLTMVVNAPVEVDPCDQITELNSVYFNFGSAELDAEAQSRLRENLALIEECPNVCVQINAYADHAESNPQRLSERRAQAVEQFYINNGIAASRLMARGLGRAPVNCDKEDPDRGCRNSRRAESIPMDCDDMQR